MNIALFKRTIWSYYRKYGRTMPWRSSITPYRVVVSEIMLQQTQVDRVIPKFRSFIKKFPSFRVLAKAPTAAVVREWQGLGFNRRALALKRLAEIVVRDYHGQLPSDRDILEGLPGIGPQTAGSIVAFAFNQPVVFIETNIRSVFIDFFYPSRKKVTDKELLSLISAALDTKNPREWYWALMDYGSSIKKNGNPSRRSSNYTKQSAFHGSNRQLRGLILRLLVNHTFLRLHDLVVQSGRSPDLVVKNIEQLKEEGFLEIRGSVVRLAR